MTNRNFDSRVIIQRLRDQNNAQNLYRYQQLGIQGIRNPQISDSSSERILSYRSGQETTYYKNLIGGGYISSIGGVANILAENIPIITSNVVPSAPQIDHLQVARGGILLIFFIKGSDGGSVITDYQYNLNGGSYISVYPDFPTIDPTIFVLSVDINSLPSNTYIVTIKAINSNGSSPASNSDSFTK